ncbi:DUF4880 domain-containing protein [Duganella sp. FT80W]|uniref:DUF4880 domain-containing protein n=1 Tax=Duganella guangzhouensis TaxID=2666084 RepID=A0A6I2L580_9BURK|nr:FecR domain-containing protein [Duganella guangzhouensis]MRW92933.1 DUF4880 domain-containing protein [Duganella guangzhouensis]
MASEYRHDPIAEQAAQWIMLLTADDAAERRQARAGFDAWRGADPRHAAAAAELEQFIGKFSTVRANSGDDSRAASAALDAAHTSRQRRQRVKRLSAAVTLAVVLAAPAWLALQAWPVPYLLADLRTGTGQWQTQLLADGSRITLNSGSAVNLHYDASRRSIELVQGEMLVDVAKDAQRPFVVETADGSIRALGTHFVVERKADATTLSMIESKVAVQTANQRAAHTSSSGGTLVTAGQRVRITAGAVTPAEAIDTRSLADAWRRHQLVVRDLPLSDVLDQLARHRRGHIHYDRAQIAQIRVNAVLPLDDSDAALQLLLVNFPTLRIRTITPWLVLVDAP